MYIAALPSVTCGLRRFCLGMDWWGGRGRGSTSTMYASRVIQCSEKTEKSFSKSDVKSRGHLKPLKPKPLIWCFNFWSVLLVWIKRLFLFRRLISFNPCPLCHRMCIASTSSELTQGIQRLPLFKPGVYMNIALHDMLWQMPGPIILLHILRNLSKTKTLKCLDRKRLWLVIRFNSNQWKTFLPIGKVYMARVSSWHSQNGWPGVK